jgi:hypothetical protein
MNQWGQINGKSMGSDSIDISWLEQINAFT